jgi:hypothetical protein
MGKNHNAGERIQRVVEIAKEYIPFKLLLILANGLSYP